MRGGSLRDGKYILSYLAVLIELPFRKWRSWQDCGYGCCETSDAGHFGGMYIVLSRHLKLKIYTDTSCSLGVREHYVVPHVAHRFKGKCPVIVDPNYDFVMAAKRISWGKFTNCGQVRVTSINGRSVLATQPPIMFLDLRCT